MSQQVPVISYMKVAPTAQLVCEGGEPLDVPVEVYHAFFSFMKTITRPAGRVEIHFKNGGVAEVSVETRLK